MSEEIFRGLSIDLTTVLTRRNKDCAEAKDIIGRLITSLILGDKAHEQTRQDGINAGRRWLAEYNSRVYAPKAEAPHV